MIERLSSSTWLASATGAAILCRICLALFTYGSNDASMWESSAALIRETGGRSIYIEMVDVRDPQGQPLHLQIFNHPPFMIRVLAAMNAVNSATGIPVRVTLRLLDALADLGTILLTAAMLRHLLGSIPLPSMLLAILAPSWLFISGFHTNSDPLMVFLLLLAVYLIEVRGRVAWGTLAFVFASGIKIVPILLLPALLWSFSTWRDRFRALLLFTVFWVITAMPWLVLTPLPMAHRLLGYRGLAGQWGIGLLLAVFGGVPQALFNRYGSYLMAVVLVWVAYRMNRGGARVSLFYQFGFLLFLFHALTPGFGIQYLAWLTPWVTVLPLPVAAAHIAAASTFCATAYTYWSGGLPWYFADSVRTSNRPSQAALLTVLAGLGTWVSVLAAVRAYVRGRMLKPARR